MVCVIIQAVLLSIALVLDSLLNKDWLIVEPTTSNPFKLVAGGLRYAWTHIQSFKVHLPTKITGGHTELIMPKQYNYGGPFSTEQVEDVKTFLRIISALVPMGAAVTIVFLCISSILILFSEP